MIGLSLGHGDPDIPSLTGILFSFSTQLAMFQLI